MVSLFRGNGLVMRRFDRYGRLVVAVALVTALGLGGCGRKGPLDAPPSAAVSGGAMVAPQPAAEPSEGFLGRRPEPAQPETQTTTARKSFFLDWLLN
jgi:predicted small lipoprotein YifL